MHAINIKIDDIKPKKYLMCFYMMLEDSAACYVSSYIDDISEYYKIVYDGFPKIQTIKGFTRFCGWLESGRPKTFKLKELEYIALHLDEGEGRRFAIRDVNPKKVFSTEISIARNKQIAIIRNATKEPVPIKRCDTKDVINLEPHQEIILFGDKISRIIGGKEKKASVCAEKMQ